MTWLSFVEDVEANGTTTIPHKVTYPGFISEANIFLENSDLGVTIFVGSKIQVPEGRDYIFRFTGNKRFLLNIPVKKGEFVRVVFTNASATTAYFGSVFIHNIRRLHEPVQEDL